MALNNIKVEPSFNKKIPLTIVTGLLGSGKSTLINQLVASNQGFKIAIIVNEFGQSGGIDKKLFSINNENNDLVEDWLELSNGCVCCSIKNAGLKAIEDLVLRKPELDYVVLETSGLADPGPIINSFWIDEKLESPIVLDGVITVCDIKNYYLNFIDVKNKEYRNLAFKQIAFADVVLINKIDLVDESEISDNQESLRKINTLAKFYRTKNSKIQNFKDILNINAYEKESIQNAHQIYQYKYPEINTSSLNIGTITIYFDSPCNIDKIEEWIQSIIWEQCLPFYHSLKVEIYRVKALIKTKGQWAIVQGVQEQYELKYVDETLAEKINNRIVLIGKNLNLEEFQDSFLKYTKSNS